MILSWELFVYPSGNSSPREFCLKLKEIIHKGNITWSEMGQQTNEVKTGLCRVSDVFFNRSVSTVNACDT